LRQTPDRAQHRFDVVALRALVQLEGTHDPRHGVLGQELQNADVLSRPSLRSQALFQAFACLGEQGRQLPIPKNIGMVERRRPSPQAGQVMHRIEDLLVLPIAARVPCHHCSARDDVEVVHVALDGHRAERVRTRHAVAVAVELHGLVLIDLGRSHDAGIKGMFR
jgi:hypothetical protein